MAVWDDAVFLWDPGDAVTASSDLITLASASGITEGSIVTHLGRTGRAYSGAVASRFASPIFRVDPEQDWSAFVVVRLPSAADLWAITIANAADTDRYGMIRPRSGAAGELDIRGNGASVRGAANWPAVNLSNLSGNTDFVVYVLTFDATSGDDGTLVGYEDSSTAVGSDVYASGTSEGEVNRLSIGRLERSSPVNSTGGEVYAVGVWSRPITTTEIDEILANPFAYLGGAITVNVGQAIESETANAITPLISREVTVGTAAEVETAGAVTPLVSREVQVGSALEAETANPITPMIARDVPVGQASEVELAQPISPLISRFVEVGTATERELGGTISPVKPIFVDLGTVIERELAQLITPVISSIGMVETVECEVLSGTAVCSVSRGTAECETLSGTAVGRVLL